MGLTSMNIYYCRPIDKVQNLRKKKKKEGKYAKTLVLTQVAAIFLMLDMQRISLPTFIEICMELPCC